VKWKKRKRERNHRIDRRFSLHNLDSRNQIVDSTFHFKAIFRLTGHVLLCVDLRCVIQRIKSATYGKSSGGSDKNQATIDVVNLNLLIKMSVQLIRLL
jgi:hypothetical protein